MIKKKNNFKFRSVIELSVIDKIIIVFFFVLVLTIDLLFPKDHLKIHQNTFFLVGHYLGGY